MLIAADTSVSVLETIDVCAETIDEVNADCAADIGICIRRCLRRNY